MAKIKALIDSGSGVNAMTSTYIVKLSRRPRLTKIGTQKINGSPPKTDNIISTRFSLQDSQRRLIFFKKTFMLVNISITVVLGVSFLSFRIINIEFVEELRKLNWRSYIVTKIPSTTCRIELIIKKNFAKAALKKNLKTFVIYISVLEVISIHPS